MEIVVEYVLLENFLINIIVLKSVALLLNEKGHLFWLSALIASCVNLALPILYVSVFGSFLLQFGMAFVIICLSFNFKTIKKFAQICLCYFLVNFIYGGACFVFEQMFGIKNLLVVLLIMAATYLIFKILFKKLWRKKDINNFCYDVEIEIAGKKCKGKAFLDSGNLLFDPLTKRPVSLINFKVFSSLFSDIDLEDVLRKADKLKKINLAHYISMGTLSNDGKILVFEADKICVKGQVLEKPILGLSLSNFNAAFGTDIILHNTFAGI